ncbi:MAG: hypothetical protein CMJ46_07300 [Planctomyces sp.]|nr:hypothetical protein [Planctomyces sp.]
MKLKDALGICLISFFSATLVVLIARSLDLQAANRLEPHLVRIADRLESLQSTGALHRAMPKEGLAETPDDGLVVHYFHGSTRCITCEAIESQTEATVKEHFQPQLAAGDLAWKISNYEDPRNAEIASQFEIVMPVVVIERYAGGELKDWRRLDEVWGLVVNESRFSKFIQDNINDMLTQIDSQIGDTDTVSEAGSDATIPAPDNNSIPYPAN